MMTARRPHWTSLVSALWGFAEATLFFIIPDVWLCGVAVRSGWRAGVRCLLWSMAGALLGGMLIYQLAVVRPEATRAAILAVPGLKPSILDRGRAHLGPDGWGMVPGGFSFLPYKAYALEAPAAGMGWTGFFSQSVAGRASRFAFSLGLTLVVAGWLRRKFPAWSAHLIWVHVLWWMGIYAAYFLVVIPRL